MYYLILINCIENPKWVHHIEPQFVWKSKIASFDDIIFHITIPCWRTGDSLGTGTPNRSTNTNFPISHGQMTLLEVNIINLFT